METGSITRFTVNFTTPLEYSLSTSQYQLPDLLWMSSSHYNIPYQQNRINYQIYWECHHHYTTFLINKTGSISRFTVNVTITLRYSLSTKLDQLSDLLWISPSHYNVPYQQTRVSYQIYCECHHCPTTFLINKTGSIIRFSGNVTIKHHKKIFGEILTWNKTKIWITRTGIQVKEVLRMGTVILIADLVNLPWRLLRDFWFLSLFCLDISMPINNCS